MVHGDQSILGAKTNYRCCDYHLKTEAQLQLILGNNSQPHFSLTLDLLCLEGGRHHMGLHYRVGVVFHDTFL